MVVHSTPKFELLLSWRNLFMWNPASHTYCIEYTREQGSIMDSYPWIYKVEMPEIWSAWVPKFDCGYSWWLLMPHLIGGLDCHETSCSCLQTLAAPSPCWWRSSLNTVRKMQVIKSWMINTIQLCTFIEKMVFYTTYWTAGNQKYWSKNVGRRAGMFRVPHYNLGVTN